MPDNDQIQRIAAALNALRPDWRAQSLVTFLTKHHADRPYQDLLIAGVIVALDPTTQTPQLLNQHGRWWVAAQQVAAATVTPTPGPGRRPRCTVSGHEHEAADNCRSCAADRLVTGDRPVQAVPAMVPPPSPARAAGPVHDPRALAAGKDT